jgi:hypothetical protein
MSSTPPSSLSRLSQRVVAAALAASIGLLPLAGCETPGGPGMPGGSASSQSEQLTPAEQQLRQDQKRFNSTVIAGVMTGAVAGAATGALAAWLTGHNSKEVRNTAIAGAVVGGTVVGIDAYVTAKKEQAGRTQLRATQAAVADVQQDNGRLRAYLETSSRVLAEGKGRLAALRSDVAAKKLSAEQARQARVREERNIASMNETLAQAKKTRDQYAEASTKLSGTAQDKRDIDNEIRRMNTQISQLEGNVAEYNRALQVSRG